MKYTHFFLSRPALCSALGGKASLPACLYWEERQKRRSGVLSTRILNVDMLQHRKRELTSLQMKQGLKCFVEQQPSSLVMNNSDKRNKEASRDSLMWLQWSSCSDGCWRVR